MIEEHLKLLGLKVEDKITGFTGIVTAISFDLYGCVQAIVSAGTDKDGKLKDSNWFDVKRLEVLSQKLVMPIPSFVNEPGPEAKPLISSDPLKR